MLGHAREREDASFDLTPMIDVVLLLIIFFMLSSQFANISLRPMDLPREAGVDAPPPDARAAIVIDMDRDGALSVLGQPTTLDDLPGVVAGRDASPTLLAQTTITVRADRACSAAHLNRLAETLVGLGARNWRLATSGERGGAGGAGGS